MGDVLRRMRRTPGRCSRRLSSELVRRSRAGREPAVGAAASEAGPREGRKFGEAGAGDTAREVAATAQNRDAVQAPPGRRVRSRQPVAFGGFLEWPFGTLNL